MLLKQLQEKNLDLDLEKKTLKLSVHECSKLKPMTPTLAYRPKARGLLLPRVPRVAAFRSPGMEVESLLLNFTLIIFLLILC